MRKNLILLLCTALLLSLLGGCAARDSYNESSFYAMNTFVTVRLSTVAEDGTRVSKARLLQIHAECERIVAEIENAVSVTVADSDTARLNVSDDGISDCGVHFSALIERSLQIADRTGGAFSPTLRLLNELWDVTGAGYVPTEAEIAEALLHTDYRALSVIDGGVTKSDPLIRLDFGGIAKGYAAQLLVSYLESTELSHGLVSLGGNVGLFGQKENGEPYKIGVSDPQSPSSVLGYLDLTDGFVSVSGDYERYFEKDGERYHHIFDAKTGAPARSGLLSVAVASDDGTLADALSTALFVMGVDRALAFYESGVCSFEAVLVTDDGRVILTPGLTETFALATDAYTVQTSNAEVQND